MAITTTAVAERSRGSAAAGRSPAPALLLPEGSRLVHIGPHKTGSTAIQVALFQDRADLTRHGVYYPGRARRRRKAGEELMRSVRPGHAGRPLHRWPALVREVAEAGPLRVCVSDETYGKCTDDRILARIVHDFGGDRVHVVAVARRYDRYLPSQWQERVKAGVPDSYEDWLRVVLRGDPSSWEHRNVWGGHDTGALVRRWLRHVDPDRFTLVVADESDRSHLPAVFEELLGLPPGLLRPDPRRCNQSRQLPETELLRAVSQAMLARGWTRAEYQPVSRAMVEAVEASSSGVGGPSRPTMPAWAADLVRELSDARVETVRALPVRVVGSPEWLRAGPMDEPSVDVDELRVSLDVAAAVAATLVATSPRAASA